MQRYVVGLTVVFLGCLALPASLIAEDVDEFFSRGVAWYNKGEYDKAIAAYNQALRIIDPNDTACISIVYLNRGSAWYGRREFEKAIADFNQTIRIDPNNSDAYSNRGNVWAQQCEYDKAIADYNQAIRIDPNNFDAFNNRGSVWTRKSEYDKAIIDLNEAIRLDPNVKRAFRNRATAWEKKREYDKAIADCNDAIRLDPKDVIAYNVLAWLYATCPDEKHRDGKKAIEKATETCKLSLGRNWHYIDTLAAAYAESGDFEKAKEWEAKAINLVATDKSVAEKDKVELRSRLELYKQGKPYHETVSAGSNPNVTVTPAQK
jgi:tetratricopeptide (TPR) repeat protein